jgi:hypothetical protein
VVTLEGVEDFGPLVPGPSYATLREYVDGLGAGVATVDSSLTIEELLTCPAVHRGALVRVQGLLIHAAPIRFDPLLPPRDGGAADAWRVLLVDPSGTECWVADLSEPPPAVEQRRDLVEVEGAFLQVLRYPSRDGTPRLAPLLVARRLVRVAEERLERPADIDLRLLIVGAGGGLVVASLLVLPRGGLRPRSHPWRRAGRPGGRTW